VQQGETVAVLWSFLLSVVFGMVHIAGPGHGKAFAISYFGGRSARIREGLFYSALVNIVDSVSAGLLVVIGYVALSGLLPSFRVDAPRVLRMISYGLVSLMGAGLLVHTFGHRRRHRDEQHDEHHSHPQAKKVPWVLAVSVGLVPCPVSTVLLVYGIVHHVLPLMILMVLGTTVGGFIAMSLITSAVIAGRGGVFRRLEKPLAERVGTILETASAVSIAVIGIGLFAAAV
jgi:ABC-type nickel/cobalt efflux system permease component RcnA